MFIMVVLRVTYGIWGATSIPVPLCIRPAFLESLSTGRSLCSLNLGKQVFPCPISNSVVGMVEAAGDSVDIRADNR